MGQEERYPPPRSSDCCRFRSGDLRRDAPQRARCAETGHWIGVDRTAGLTLSGRSWLSLRGIAGRAFFAVSSFL